MSRWAYMAADVVDEGDEIIVRLEDAGRRREKRFDRESRPGGYQLVQCAYGAFRREVPLPVEVKADRAEATYRDGVLRIVLPKADGSRPARIAVAVH